MVEVAVILFVAYAIAGTGVTFLTNKHPKQLKDVEEIKKDDSNINNNSAA